MLCFIGEIWSALQSIDVLEEEEEEIDPTVGKFVSIFKQKIPQDAA